jgi:hypothetical protein
MPRPDGVAASRPDRSRSEFVRDTRARALRVLDGTQTGRYTKRALASDIVRLTGLLVAAPSPLGEVGEASSRYVRWYMETFGSPSVRDEVLNGE